MSPRPPKQRNLEHDQKQPSRAPGHRNQQDQCEPLPERHSLKLMLHDPCRQSCFYLPRFDLIIELGNFRERVGRDQPDLSRRGVRNAGQLQLYVNVARRNGAQILPVGRDSLLGRPLRLSADMFQAPCKGAIHHNLQLLRHRFALGLASCCAHLQILGGDAVVA